MIAEILIERLDEPNRNGHIYTTKCIDDTIINNKAVQERVFSGTEFILDGSKTRNADNVLQYLSGGCYPFTDIVGRVLKYYIKDDCLYATVEMKDDMFTENLYMAGLGTVNKDGTLEDYEFGMIYKSLIRRKANDN